MNIKAIILIVLVIVYLYEMTLHLIKMRSVSNPIPDLPEMAAVSR